MSSILAQSFNPNHLDQFFKSVDEANHWKTFCFILAIIAGGAVYSRDPAPSVVKAYGVSSDVNGHPVVTQLAAYKPDDQAIRTALRESVEPRYTIEPVLTDDIQQSRMARNINAVKGMMVGNARNQFGDWVKMDAPFQRSRSIQNCLASRR